MAAGLLTVRYLGSIQKAPPAVVEMRTVVVASRDIPAHQKILPEMLAKVQKTADQVGPGSLTDPKQAEDDVSLVAIPAGAAVTSTQIGEPASIGITSKLAPGMRAISIPVDYVKSVSGLIEPGDRVDVLASSGRGKATRTIIRGAVVLAVNDSLEPQPPSTSAAPAGSVAASSPAAVTLGVTPEQANALTYADLNTTLRLALRSPGEPVRSFAPQALTMDDPDSGAARPDVPSLRPLPAASASAAAPAAKPTPGIQVIEGSEIVEGLR
ncbi:MAG: Flp pilus assembly protein CpaB [Candidatus Eremiobacteraeota bacterium]|nr:Flp pilus assembly protein CpaB [Candidatus Eremiobacteraeota bacterium]